MTPAKLRMQAAAKLLSEGRLAEAEAAYRAVKAAEPRNFLATYNLGIVLLQQGRPADGEPFFAEAAKLNPDILAAQVVHASVLAQLGRVQEAIQTYDRVLARDPKNRDALNDRASCLLREGRYAEALTGLDRLLSLDPQNPIALYNRASVLASFGKPGDALRSLETACALKPGFADGLFFKGNLLRGLGRTEAARAAYEAAVAAKPDHFDCLNNMGDLLSEGGHFTEALAAFDKALILSPRNLDILVNRARVLGKLGRTADELAAYDQALALNPAFAPAHLRRGVALFGLRLYEQALESLDRTLALAPRDEKALEVRGNTLMLLGRKTEALASYEAALAIKPSIEGLFNYGHGLRRVGRCEEAAKAYAQVLEAAPDHPQAKGYMWASRLYCCDWRNAAAGIDSLVADTMAGRFATSPFVLVQFSNSAEAQLHAAQLFIASRKKPAAPWTPASRDTARIRIAYLSADFQTHATAFLMAGMFEAHDRSKFETIAVSFARDDGGPYRRRLQGAFDRFIDASAMTDAEVIKTLREMPVDIAVDLKGFTNDARPEIFFERTAPLQVSFVGYPGTWGAACMDYIVADPWLIPPEDEKFYSESVVRMPDSYQPNDREREIAERMPTRAEVGLPAEGFVFCSFNNSYKILPPVFDIWMRLLAQVPGSVLWLLGTNEAATRNLRREAAARDVSPDRLIFAPVAPPADHLARQKLADLFLDTLPCTAHTTASDALWVGLPLLTCVGETFAGRVAASLLSAAGLPEFITRSLAEYEALALKLAATPGALGQLKAKLAGTRMSCALFDTEKFCRNLEAAYLAMWDRQTRGQPPVSFNV
ncbi:MAG: tetratricopeptide repeat protein [Rhodospirillaceae bacterium]